MPPPLLSRARLHYPAHWVQERLPSTYLVCTEVRPLKDYIYLFLSVINLHRTIPTVRSFLFRSSCHWKAWVAVNTHSGFFLNMDVRYWDSTGLLTTPRATFDRNSEVDEWFLKCRHRESTDTCVVGENVRLVMELTSVHFVSLLQSVNDCINQPQCFFELGRAIEAVFFLGAFAPAVSYYHVYMDPYFIAWLNAAGSLMACYTYARPISPDED